MLACLVYPLIATYGTHGWIDVVTLCILDPTPHGQGEHLPLNICNVKLWYISDCKHIRILITGALGWKIWPKNNSGSSGCSPRQWPGTSCPGLRTITSPSTSNAHGRFTIVAVIRITLYSVTNIDYKSSFYSLTDLKKRGGYQFDCIYLMLTASVA